MARLTPLIGSTRLPKTQDALAEHRERIQTVLVAARVARAGLSASLSRVRAAAGFTYSRVAQVRQGIGASAKS